MLPVFIERLPGEVKWSLKAHYHAVHDWIQLHSFTSLLLLQIWLLNSDSIAASVPETHVGGEENEGPSLRAARALKLLYTTCSDADDQQRE